MIYCQWRQQSQFLQVWQSLTFSTAFNSSHRHTHTQNHIHHACCSNLPSNYLISVSIILSLTTMKQLSWYSIVVSFDRTKPLGPLNSIGEATAYGDFLIQRYTIKSHYTCVGGYKRGDLRVGLKPLPNALKRLSLLKNVFRLRKTFGPSPRHMLINLSVRIYFYRYPIKSTVFLVNCFVWYVPKPI